MRNSTKHVLHIVPGEAIYHCLSQKLVHFSGTFFAFFVRWMRQNTVPRNGQNTKKMPRPDTIFLEKGIKKIGQKLAENRNFWQKFFGSKLAEMKIANGIWR